MPKVTWISVDDWEALYVDGVMVGEQGHSLSPWTWERLLSKLGVEFENLRYSQIAEETLEGTWREVPGDLAYRLAM